jgi:phosphoribosylaminoimidazole-succinocarboxamide synthase
MTLSPPLIATSFPGLAPARSGKVRDLFDADNNLVIVATDRISAFDYVLGSGIPDKGKVLTQLSTFWFDLTADVVPNHVLSVDPQAYPAELRAHADVLRGRSMLVRRTETIPIECVVRGYLVGSGWAEYRKSGTVCGINLPAGLREADRLPEPIFTPSTKAETGHDVNISQEEAGRLVGQDLIETLARLSIEVYSIGAAHAETRGIIVADTKFEFGILRDGGREQILLIDEVLTPDSSRFWPADAYKPGGSQPSFDKQFVRDYLERIKWNKQPPVPSLPDDVIAGTREKYVEALRRLAGHGVDERG